MRCLNFDIVFGFIALVVMVGYVFYVKKKLGL